MIELNKDKLKAVKPLFRKEIEKIKENSLAPWQEKRRAGGVCLFPEQNNDQAIEFLFLLGALNFSYWKKDSEGEIYTWELELQGGRNLLMYLLWPMLSPMPGRGAGFSMVLIFTRESPKISSGRFFRIGWMVPVRFQC